MNIPPSILQTPGFSHFSLAWSPFHESRIALASSANFGLVGNGRLHIVSRIPGPPGLNLDKFFETQDCVYDVAWSEVHENQLVTASGDGSIRLWDIMLKDFAIRAWQEHTREVYSVDWSNIKKDTFVSASWDGNVKLWTPERPRSLLTLQAHQACVYQALFSPHQPDIIATCSTDGTMKIFDIRTPSYAPTNSFTNPVSAAALTVPASGGEILTLDWNKYRPFVLATGGVDKMVRIWDCRMIKLGESNQVGGTCEIQLPGHEYAVRKVQWSPHRPDVISTASYDMTCRVLRLVLVRRRPISHLCLGRKIKSVSGLDVTSPKDVLDEFEQLAEADNVDPFAETASKRQLNKGLDARLDRISGDGQDVEYKVAMRLASMEKEEARRRVEEKGNPRSLVDRTPTASELLEPTIRKRRWDSLDNNETVETKKRRSRWDATPAVTPILMPLHSHSFTNHELDLALPSSGYSIVNPPVGYLGRKFHQPESEGFQILLGSDAAAIAAAAGLQFDSPSELLGLEGLKPADTEHFAKILGDEDETMLSVDEMKERKVMRLLLRIKSGTPAVRKTALRQITAKAPDFGPEILFNKLLPLLMERTLEEQERHLLVKVMDRIIYRLDNQILIDEDYYARVEGREIISNLAKAAGLAHMISAMRPDIDHADEYVRNTTARAFAVVAVALGIPCIIPFLKAVCRSKKSWQARHTGIRIVQQIAFFLGSALLPHLRILVDCIAHGLSDEQQKVRTMTALALAGLAEAAAPYGIESFDNVLKPLWLGLKQHRGKGLAAFLKAVGFIIPLMDPEDAASFTNIAMKTLIEQFSTSDEELKRIVLKVLQQCANTEGVTGVYIESDILPQFFKAFWVRRMALDKRNHHSVIATTIALARKVDSSFILEQLVDGLKDDAELYRQMIMGVISKLVRPSILDEGLERRLVDGMLFAFQEQTTESSVMLNGFGTIANVLGIRLKPYLLQIASMILWRLNNKSAKVRQQAADLTTRLAVVMKQCGEEQLLSKLGLVLFEQLGEEYPDTLGSIINALSAITTVVGMSELNPPVKDLVPRLTPILRNRHEKVQEACINLLGRIADRGAEFSSAREWMRICFELLGLLKAQKKAIRRAAVNTFGYIAKSLGPQDVIAVLLTNLRVQDRQSRVGSAIAIAIVAEVCGPFTTIPAILNEYRTAELNVRTGCLKAMSYVFEYIGPQATFYVDSVIGMLEDALTDRDLVHRQTASTIVKHLALGVAGLGCEDSMMHLMNMVWANCFETSPHVITAVMEAIEAMRVALGPGILLSYLLQGLFHPARKVREVYWRLYNGLYLGNSDALVPFYPDLGQLDIVYGCEMLQVFL
ncbi:armadillo-type protein [Mycena floridula]|nr:armadillo-type protein [Mycena floridula]